MIPKHETRTQRQLRQLRRCAACGANEVRCAVVETRRGLFSTYFHRCGACERRFTTENLPARVASLVGGPLLIAFAITIFVKTGGSGFGVAVKVVMVGALVALGIFAIARTANRIRELRRNPPIAD